MIAWTIIGGFGSAPRQRALSVWRVECQVIGDLGLPTIAIGQQFFLVVQEFLVRLRCKFEIWTLDNCVNRARLLTIAAVDAFRHIDIIARRAPAAILPGLGLDRDCEGWTDRLA